MNRTLFTSKRVGAWFIQIIKAMYLSTFWRPSTIQFTVVRILNISTLLFKMAMLYAYQEKGKWGVYQEKTLKGAGSKSYETRYIPFLPAKYDAAIEVVGPQDYWLVKENGVWKAFSTRTGKELKKCDRVVNLLLGLPILNPTFALGRPEKCHREDQKRAKTSLLRSEGRKSALREGKNAQKHNFCARRARKVPSGRPADDKNLDFVLARPENLAKIDQKRTKWALLSSKAPKMAVLEGKKGQKPQFCPRTGPKTSKS